MTTTENFGQIEGNRYLQAIDDAVIRVLRDELSKYINVPVVLDVVDAEGNKVLNDDGTVEQREVDFNQLYDMAVKQWILVDHNVVTHDHSQFIEIDFYKKKTTISIPVKTKYNIEIMKQGREIRGYSDCSSDETCTDKAE